MPHKCCINELIIPSSSPPGEWKGLVPTQARLLDWEEFIKNCTRALDTEDQQEFIQSYAEEEEGDGENIYLITLKRQFQLAVSWHGRRPSRWRWT